MMTPPYGYINLNPDINQWKSVCESTAPMTSLRRGTAGGALDTTYRSSLLHMSPFCYESNYGIKLTNRQSKIRQMPLLEQPAKYSSRQNFRLYGMYTHEQTRIHTYSTHAHVPHPQLATCRTYTCGSCCTTMCSACTHEMLSLCMQG